MRARAVVAMVLLLAGFVAGCFDPHLFPRCRSDGDVPDYAAGEHTLRVCIGRELRTAVVVVPEGAATPAPLLLMLHGGGGNGEHMRDNYAIDDDAAAAGVVLAFPEGTPARRGSDVRTWNAMHCCGKAFAEGSDDVAFLGDLVETLLAAWPLDATRVGVAGHSNGAMMAYRLAAERSDVITSVVAVAGAVGGEADPGDEVRRVPPPDQPVPAALILHARDDPRVPFEGGQGQNLDGPRVDLAVADAVNLWVAASGSNGHGIEVERDDGVQQIDYSAGSTVAVRLLVTEGGHGWPGAPPGVLNQAPSVPDASAEAVRFVLEHPRTT